MRTLRLRGVDLTVQTAPLVRPAVYRSVYKLAYWIAIHTLAESLINCADRFKLVN